jgi:hypothetical protein
MALSRPTDTYPNESAHRLIKQVRMVHTVRDSMDTPAVVGTETFFLMYIIMYA